jgi:transposase
MERRRFTREFKLEAVRLIKERGVSFAQASHDLSVHQSQLRSWVKALAADPQHAFPGQGQMKPEQLEIAQLKREVIKLKADRRAMRRLCTARLCLACSSPTLNCSISLMITRPRWLRRRPIIAALLFSASPRYFFATASAWPNSRFAALALRTAEKIA